MSNKYEHLSSADLERNRGIYLTAASNCLKTAKDYQAFADELTAELERREREAEEAKKKIKPEDIYPGAVFYNRFGAKRTVIEGKGGTYAFLCITNRLIYKDVDVMEFMSRELLSNYANNEGYTKETE